MIPQQFIFNERESSITGLNGACLVDKDCPIAVPVMGNSQVGLFLFYNLRERTQVFGPGLRIPARELAVNRIVDSNHVCAKLREQLRRRVRCGSVSCIVRDLLISISVSGAYLARK